MVLALIQPYRYVAAGGTNTYLGNGVVYNGTSQRVEKTATATGAADGKTLTIGCAVRIDGDQAGAGQTLFIHDDADVRFRAVVPAGGSTVTFPLRLRNASAGTTICDIVNATPFSFTMGVTWMQVFYSVDLSDTAKRKMLINGTGQSLTVTTYTDDTIDLTSPANAGAASGGADWLDGAMSDLYVRYAYYDIVTNVAEFWADGRPMDLAAAWPGGVQPLHFMGGNAAGILTNEGTGGAWDTVIAGPLLDTTPSW